AFELGEQIAESHVAHVEHVHAQAAALGPVVGANESDHAIALAKLFGELLAHGAPHVDAHRDVGLEVFELAVDVAAGDPPLGELALDPDAAEAVDPSLELVCEHADGPGVLLGGWGVGHASRLSPPPDAPPLIADATARAPAARRRTPKAQLRTGACGETPSK